MGRKAEYNLKYFPLMVNMGDHEKILLAEYELGKDSFSVFPIAVKLLMWIYGREGYYTKWGATSHIIFASSSLHDVSKADITQSVVAALLKVNFFSQELFDKHGILTSAGIQEQWTDIMTGLKRVGKVNSIYSAIPSEDKPISSEGIALKSEESTQSKVKESKVKESKDYLLTNKGEDEKKSVGKKVEVPGKNFLSAAPAIIPDLQVIPEDTIMAPEECLIYIFQDSNYRPQLSLICTAHRFFLPGGTDPNYEELYAWAQAFTRFLMMQRGNKGKTHKNFIQHLKNWVKDQPLTTANPDEINQPKHGKQNPNNQKIAGNTIDKTREFLSHKPNVPGLSNAPEPR